MSRYRIGIMSEFDYAVLLARREAAVVLRDQGHICASCRHLMHGGRCVERNSNPPMPGFRVPTFCQCEEGRIS